MQQRILFIAIAVSVLCGTVRPQESCAISGDQRIWIASALGTWKQVRKTSLHLPPRPTPWLILFDESCVIHVNPDTRFVRSGSTIKLGGESLQITISPHGGQIQLPENGQMPVRLASFAAPYDSGKSSFLVFALPSIWQNASHLKDEKNVDQLIKSVFVHEMTHTLHGDFYARLDEIEKKLPKGEEIDDDIIQNKFSKIDEYRSMFEAEKDLLFRAVAAPDNRTKLELAKKAYDKIRERRFRFFTQDNAIYADLEDLFLTMEGAANWAAYRAARSGGFNNADAMSLIRRGGKYWSQDEGLALFLAIDALVPNWQGRAFSGKNATALQLLADAVK